jgi:hypothetical protein
LIYDEKKEAEKLLSNGFSSFMSYKDLCTLARYFKYIGKNKTQIRKSLIDFCTKYNPEFNEILYRVNIEYAINNAQKYGLKLPILISITRSEIESIMKADGHNKQKILFVMLAFSKYSKYNNTRFDKSLYEKYGDNFYVNDKNTYVLKMAKVNMNKSSRINLFFELNKDGFIDPTFSGAYKLLYVNEESPVEIVIDDMDNLIDFFPLVCDNCGKKINKKSEKKNFCDECYKEKRREDIKNNVKTHRNKDM